MGFFVVLIILYFLYKKVVETFGWFEYLSYLCIRKRETSGRRAIRSHPVPVSPRKAVVLFCPLARGGSAAPHEGKVL